MQARKITIATVTVTVAGLVALGTGVAAASSHNEDRLRGRERQFTERATAVTPLDFGTPGPSQGDQFVVATDLWDNGGTKVASGGGICTVVSTTLADCAGTQVFADGQLVARGIVPLAVLAGTGRFSLAVTGGTGAYGNASGEIVGTRVDALTNTVVLRLNRR